MEHEIEKIMKRLNQIVKEKYVRIPMKDPNSEDMILLEFTRIEPEKIRIFYDQAVNGLDIIKKNKEEFEKRVKTETNNLKNELERLEKNEKELKPHFERVKVKETEDKFIKDVAKNVSKKDIEEI